MATLSNGTITTVTGIGDQVELDSQYTLFVYRDIAAGGKTYVLDTSDMTVGTAIVFDASGTGNYSVTKLSSTKAVVAYSGAGGDVKAKVLSITGKTVSAGALATVESAFNANPINQTTLDTTHTVVFYRNPISPWEFQARRLTISGTTISSVGAAQLIYSIFTKFADNAPAIYLRTLTSTKIIFVYRDTVPSPDTVSAQVCTVSGDTITPATAVTMYNEASQPDAFDIVVVSATKILVLVTNAANEFYGTIGTVSGTIITANTATLLNTVGASYADTLAARGLSATYATYVYAESGGSDTNLYVVLVNVSGITPVEEATLTVNPGAPAGSTGLARMAVLSATQFVGSWSQNSTPSAVLISVVGAEAGCRFYFGALTGALQEKFTLPFSGVAPKGMTLDKSLGTVVMAADGANSDPVVYSTNPYITGTVTDIAFPETAASVVVKWI